MEFSVTKIVWEYGEKYGDVFYPHTLSDLQKKIKELDSWGRKNDYPFLIGIHFTDESYLGLTVGHDLSYMEFYSYISEKAEQRQGPYYLVNPEGDIDEFIFIYYMASHSDIETTKMIPQYESLQAVYHYVVHKAFPPFIRFDDNEVNKNFICTACQDNCLNRLSYTIAKYDNKIYPNR